ncbi:MAG: protein kinase domain-containing protein, partial [Ktedonobacteraceae bacterium]
MICPRCGNEWDATKSPCTRCGLVIRVPNQGGPSERTTPPPTSQQQTTSQQFGGASSSRPLSGDLSGALPTNNPNAAGPAWSSRTSANAPRFFNSPTVPTTEGPRSSNSLPGFGDNRASGRSPSRPLPGPGQAPMQTGVPRTEGLNTQGVPPRPQKFPQAGQPITDTFGQDPTRSSAAPRANRLVTDSLTREPQRRFEPVAPALQREGRPSNGSSQTGGRTFNAENRQLMPGTLLRGGRYRLQEMQERQEWLAGVVENMWIAQDAHRGASQVMIRELVLPESGSMVIQSTLRTATMALTSVGRHPHIPTLWDAFSDRGRNFFVFEPVEGESLMSRMRRTGRAMQEQDVIECCLQMTEILELLSQQSPPLAHGLISPEHILITRTGSQYVLTNFSIVLAGGATQFISGIDRTRLTVYAAPEFVRGVIDVRSDLFSLMATAYHAVTGSIPAGVSGSIPQAQRVNPHVSQQFDAILAKGLRPIASQRYQRPSELRQDLLAMRSVTGTLVPGSPQRFEAPAISQPISRERQYPGPTSQEVPDSIVQAFQSLAPSEDIEEQRLLLPRPEELPPMEGRNDTL